MRTKWRHLRALYSHKALSITIQLRHFETNEKLEDYESCDAADYRAIPQLL